MIKNWKQSQMTIQPGVATMFTPTTGANIVQIVNRTASGGGIIYADDASNPNVSSTFYSIKIDQGNTGAIVRPAALGSIYLNTDAGGPLTVTLIEIESVDLSFVFNASQLLQIQGSVKVEQPVQVDGTVAISGTVNVAEQSALPAGTNNIGHVNVDALPALPAGTNVIGHVDVDSLPALPAGTNTIGTVISQNGNSSLLNITAATIVKAAAGRLVRISVLVAGTTAGSANDVATTGGAAAANQIATIPNTVGVIELDWPCTTGIVVTPGTGQTIAVSYQ